jgi:hypothetical protein
VFTIRLSRASGKTVTVDYSCSDGTAMGGLDYIPTNGTITFLPGITNRTVRIAVYGDRLNESSETFFVHLETAVNATIADGEGMATIRNNDALPTISVGDTTALEGEDAVFTVRLSAASGRSVSVNYATASGRALDGSDFTGVSGTLVFDPGVTSLSVSVPTINDGIPEANETFTLNLSGTVNATIKRGRGTATLSDNIATPIAPAAALPVWQEDLRITATAVSGNDFRITFTTVEGASYVVEYCDDLATATWTPASEPLVASDGTLSFTHPDGAKQPHRFYRVRALGR